KEELAVLAAVNSSPCAVPAPSTKHRPAHSRRFGMRPSLALACVGVGLAALTAGTSRSHAQYAAQLYPYCALDRTKGATTCYYRSREECGRPCISNPWYLGAERARAYTHRGRPVELRYWRP